jgi:uncharacterized membrane protein
MRKEQDFESPKEKSIFRIVLGILFFVIAFTWIALRLVDGESIRVFDWIYTLVFALQGFVHTYEGLGNTLRNPFG